MRKDKRETRYPVKITGCLVRMVMMMMMLSESVKHKHIMYAGNNNDQLVITTSETAITSLVCQVISYNH